MEVKMLRTLMEDEDNNRLDFAAPLLSVRGKPNCCTSFPFYKSDVKSGPVRNPGVVPFVWEQSPGLPKTGNGGLQLLSETAKVVVDGDGGGDEEETFSDAQSYIETCSMNCSLSGLTGLPDTAAGGQISADVDPHVRDFMMGRFLPAAKAVANGSLHTPPRKPATRRADNGEHRHCPDTVERHPQPRQVRNCYSEGDIEEEEDDDDDGYDDSTTKGCGFLPRFCLKTPFCILNPIPVNKFDEKSWEIVHKQKLESGHQNHQHQVVQKGGDAFELRNCRNGSDKYWEICLKPRTNERNMLQTCLLSSADESKLEDGGKNHESLLDSLLPKSPSESWLSRINPSAMSKDPVSKSFLGAGKAHKRGLKNFLLQFLIFKKCIGKKISWVQFLVIKVNSCVYKCSFFFSNVL